MDELNKDILKLRGAWVAESVCPELLPFEQDLVEGMTELVENQETVLSEVEQSPEQVFSATLYMMDIERCPAPCLSASSLRC